jgi:hypothetical protein
VSSRDLTGAELARRFFTGVVAPLLSRAVPTVGYAAARLGSGSDVLGLDDEMSRDHDWGCRLTLLVDEDARDQVPRIRQILEERLPERFGEFPVRFPVTWDSSVSHKVQVATVAEFAASRLGVDPAGGLSVLDWLTVTGQSVLEVTAGPEVARLPPMVGSIEQWVDSTDVLSSPGRRAALQAAYRAWVDAG